MYIYEYIVRTYINKYNHHTLLVLKHFRHYWSNYYYNSAVDESTDQIVERKYFEIEFKTIIGRKLGNSFL